ncbi:MAG TPA: ZTL protein, partial [Candidatus Binatia bacterium]|nr:ZTL protein [Candidatus Binatia bacterium]
TFETTLGGNTIADLLEQAARAGHKVRIVFVGLESAEKHIERVAARVARGGHDIADEAIRERYKNSRLNLIRLLPVLDELLLYDNSDDADPDTGLAPSLKRLLHVKGGAVVFIEPKPNTACGWSKPILAAALGL